MNKCEGVYCLTLHIIVKYDLFCDNDNVQEVIWVGQRSPKVYHCALHTRLNSLDAEIHFDEFASTQERFVENDFYR